jgi:hypothetical protein
MSKMGRKAEVIFCGPDSRLLVLPGFNGQFNNIQRMMRAIAPA